jgi:hypothetical protein
MLLLPSAQALDDDPLRAAILLQRGYDDGQIQTPSAAVYLDLLSVQNSQN